MFHLNLSEPVLFFLAPDASYNAHEIAVSQAPLCSKKAHKNNENTNIVLQV
jgi:hypothetical protein